MKLSKESLKLIDEALDISSSFKVYGDGREEHQKAVEEARAELKQSIEGLSFEERLQASKEQDLY